MQNNVGLTAINPEEEKFQELIRLGDDFLRIEIYRQALKSYKQALELKPGDALVKDKISSCGQKIKYEKKVFIILLAAAVVITAVVWGIRVVSGA
jgi:tetratricopeptide (TPR) repeat protein